LGLGYKLSGYLCADTVKGKFLTNSLSGAKYTVLK
jgi:hypothetical protein